MILNPITTEKAINLIEKDNTLVFAVTRDEVKSTIKQKIEKMYEVKVLSVRTMLSPKGVKKAFVKLTKEYKADDLASKLKII